MIPYYNFRRPAKIFRIEIEIETHIIQSNQSKDRKIIVQNLSWRILFQEQVKFLKSSICFQFYNALNKDTVFWTHAVLVEISSLESDLKILKMGKKDMVSTSG